MSDTYLFYELDAIANTQWVTVTVGKAARNNLLFAQELGIFHMGKEYFTKRKGLPSYLIKYTLGGGCGLDYGDQIYELKEHHLFWIDCTQEQHYYTHSTQDHWDVIWVHFYGNSAKAYYDLFLNQNNGKNVLSMDNKNKVSAKLQKLISLYQEADYDLMTDVEASGILTTLLTEIVQATATRSSQWKMPETVSMVKSYLQNNYNQPIVLDDLAEHVHMNKFHVLRLFQANVGVTPNEFLIQTRLNKAKELLRTTDQTVTAISAAVGVPNTSHFINLFKKHEQTTPMTYRKSWDEWT